MLSLNTFDLTLYGVYSVDVTEYSDISEISVYLTVYGVYM